MGRKRDIALEDYKPTGRGRPPVDKAKLAMWKAARDRLFSDNPPPDAPDMSHMFKPTPGAWQKSVTAGVKGYPSPAHVASEPGGVTFAELEEAVALVKELKRIGLPADGLRAILGLIKSQASVQGTDHPRAAETELGPSDVVPRAPQFATSQVFPDRDVLEDLEQTQRLIDDPLAFEQAMIDGHLGTGGIGGSREDYDRQAQPHLRRG